MLEIVKSYSLLTNDALIAVTCKYYGIKKIATSMRLGELIFLMWCVNNAPGTVVKPFEEDERGFFTEIM